MNIYQFFLKQISDINNDGIAGFRHKLQILLSCFKKIPGYFFAFLAISIIRILSPLILIRIGKISENFGNTVSDFEIYLIKKKNNLDFQKKKTIDLFFLGSKEKDYNNQIVLMLRRNLKFLPNYILQPIYLINRFLKEDSKYIVNDNHYSLSQEYKSQFEKYFSLSFTADEKKNGILALQKFGLKEGDKFVCLSVRDEKFKKEIMLSNNFKPSTDFTRNDYRNWEIENFILAADNLAKKGYYVFRMGKNVKKPFNVKNEKVIDYANSKERSDFLDIFLGANCEFCISTGLGFDEVPEIFRKPTLLMGIMPIGIYRNYNKRFMVCFKHHYSKKYKKNLSLSEIFNERLAFAFASKDFEKKTN
jgi:putative glycosyltransferase (TIGR04372 family)